MSFNRTEDSKYTEGRWLKNRGTTTAWEVISDMAPKTRRVVARCGGPDREGNVSLISAAPDLLSALRMAREWVSLSSAKIEHSRDAALKIIDVAIAKAEGK